MSVAPPPPMPGAAHDLMNAAVALPSYNISKGADFVFSGDQRHKFFMLPPADLAANQLVADLYQAPDGTSSINAVGQIVQVSVDAVAFQFVGGNAAFALAYSAPIVPGVRFAVLNQVGLDWAKANSGVGNLFNFRNADSNILVAASDLAPKVAGVGEGGSGSASSIESRHLQKEQKNELSKSIFHDAVRFGELTTEGVPIGRQCTDLVISGLSIDSKLHGTLALWTNVLVKYVTLDISSTGRNITMPTVSSAKYDSQVGLLWLSPDYNPSSPVTHKIIKDSFKHFMEILDAAAGPRSFDLTGRGYYDIMSFQYLSLFDESRSHNVYAMSPVFLSGITQQLASELRWKTKPVAGLPVTERELKAALALTFAKYSFDYVSSQNNLWAVRYPIDKQEWDDLMQTDVEIRSKIKRDASSMLASSSIASSSAVPQINKVVGPKKPKTGKGKGNGKAGVSVAQVAQVSGGGGAGVGTSSVVPPFTPAVVPGAGSTGAAGRLNWTSSCKFHLKHLFLKTPDCTKGFNCDMFHQRKIKTIPKSNLLSFVNDKLSSDPDYNQLFTAIQNS